MDRNKCTALLIAGCLLALAGCDNPDPDYDGILGTMDCDPTHAHAGKPDMDIGCGCDPQTLLAKHGCPAEVNNPPGTTDGGTPATVVCTEGDTRKCGAKGPDGKLLDKGVCHLGDQTCHANAWGDCVGADMPISPAKCDDQNDSCLPNGPINAGFDLQTDVNNCGKCGNACHFDHASASCVSGVCKMGPCDQNWHDVDLATGRPTGTSCSYACVATPVTTPVCDGIDHACDGHPNEGGACECAYDPNRTVQLTQPCGKNVGICHAGQQTCQAPGKWGPCVGGNPPVTTPVCNGQDNFCDGKTDEGIDKLTDVNNCGKCGNVCHFDHAAAACVNGTCQKGACDENWYDFDGNVVNGCEKACVPAPGRVMACNNRDNLCDNIINEGFDLQKDPLNCGACGNKCPSQNGASQCVAGVCQPIVCAAGWVDVDFNTGKPTGTSCTYKCTPTPGATKDLCGGKDDDCSGTANVGCACDATPDPVTGLAKSQPIACGPSTSDGMCEFGIQTCQTTGPNKGTWSACAGAVFPTATDKCDDRDWDCDKQPHTGFNLLTDVNNCGQCGNKCSFTNAAALCISGTCVMGTCDPTWHDLDPATAKPTGTGCRYQCIPTGKPKGTCNGMDNLCDTLVNEGVDTQTDAKNCGQCGNVCNLPHVATQACVAGKCAVAGPLNCAAGWYDINHDPVDGCEYSCKPTANPAEVCDGLDNDCSGVPDDGPVTCLCYNGQTRSCGSGVGVCEPGSEVCLNGTWSTCVGGKGPGPKTCNGQDMLCDGKTNEGFDLTSDPSNCGTCGTVCSYANATPLCVSSACKMGACNPDWWDVDVTTGKPTGTGCPYHCIKTAATDTVCDNVDSDCNGLVDDGVNKQTDPLNCGACGNKCPTLNGASQCVAGVCQPIVCGAGWVDLDFTTGKPTGKSCNYKCTPTPGATKDLCQGKDDDCDGSVNKGCACDATPDPVTGLAKSQPIACGPSTNAGMCEFGTQTCQTSGPNVGTWSKCVGAVMPAPADKCDNLDWDCDSQPHTGFNLQTDPLNCGTCGNACNFPHATALCVSGTCVMGAPDQFFYDLDKSPANGAEYGPCIVRPNACNNTDNLCHNIVNEGFNLQTDPLNCGQCGNVCNLPHVATQACVAGKCAVPSGGCASGFWDVNVVSTDGCEVGFCQKTNGGVEICDGKDNDCDGLIDNLPQVCPNTQVTSTTSLPAAPVGNIDCQQNAGNAALVDVTITGAETSGLNVLFGGATTASIATMDIGADAPSFTWGDPGTNPPALAPPATFSGNGTYKFTGLVRGGPDPTGHNKFAPRVRDGSGIVLSYFQINANWSVSGLCLRLCAGTNCNVQIQ